jgi:starvation-inducible DNA-binding protein
VGPRFRSIHFQLGEVVAAARSYSDTVAERAAALGLPPDGRPETVAAAYTLPSPKDGRLRDTDVVHLLVDTLSTAIERLCKRKRITATAELEGQRWMFEAENTPSSV